MIGTANDFVFVSVIQMIVAMMLPAVMRNTGQVIGNTKQRTTSWLLIAPAILAFILAVAGLNAFGSELFPLFILACTPLLFIDGCVQARCIILVIDQHEKWRQEKEARIRSLNL